MHYAPVQLINAECTCYSRAQSNKVSRWVSLMSALH